MSNLARLPIIVALVLAGCGKESLPPFEEVSVSTRGGIHALASGVVIEVPAGAVAAETRIRVRALSDAEQNLFNGKRQHAVRLLAGFVAEPDGLSFAKPVSFRLPLTRLPTGRPFHASLDARRRYFIAATQLTYAPAKKQVVLDVSHFSHNAAVEMDLGKQPETECTAPATACRCGTIRVETSASDFGGDKCQTVSDSVKVTFLDCPGKPTEEDSVTERTPGCDEDPQPPAPVTTSRYCLSKFKTGAIGQCIEYVCGCTENEARAACAAQASTEGPTEFSQGPCPAGARPIRCRFPASTDANPHPWDVIVAYFYGTTATFRCEELGATSVP